MRSLAADYHTGISRRTVLQAAGLAIASRFTSIAGTWLEWLLRWFLIDTRLRFAG